MAHARPPLALVVSAAALAMATVAATAQTPPGPSAAAKPGVGDQAPGKDNGAAFAAYEAGLKAFQSGKMEQAAQSLSQALQAGLPARQMAKALHTRGVVFRKQGKPAQAISDLTSALWLKGGLDDRERAEATEQRAAAYREAGLGDPGAAPVSQAAVAVEPAAPTATAAKTAASPPATTAPATAASSVKSASNTAAPSGETVWTPPRAAPPAKIAETATPAAEAAWTPPRAVAPVSIPPPPPTPPAHAQAPSAPAIRQTATVSAPLPAAGPVAAPPPAAAPAASARAPQPAPPQETAAISPAPAASEAPGGGIGGFFKNLFGSSQAKREDRPSPPASAAAPMVAGWNQTTTPAPRQEVKMAALAPVPVSPPAPVTAAAAKPEPTPVPAARVSTEPAPVPAGASAYRVQVAAVRSRREADEVAARLQQEHRAKLGRRVPVVDEAVFGNMGTFYRVRLGPFAEGGEPSQLCAALNASGFDCLVLAQ